MALVYTRVDDAPLAAWRPALPPATAARLQAMANADARARSLAGLWLLETGARLAGFGGIDLRGLGRDAHGRPILCGGPVFSISHSRDVAVCAIADRGLVGVDVERIRAVDTARMARFLGDPAAGTDAQAFFAAWTAREAAVKATGRVGLARIAAVALSARTAAIDDHRLTLTYPELDADHCLCVASDQPGAEVSLHQAA